MQYRWIKIEKSLKYKFYANIRIMSITPFWHHINDTKRNPCSHCPINGLSGYLTTTVYLAVMLQVSWYIAEGK